MPEPQRFGKYLLYERIAVGGMAEVFRAKPVGGDGLLALKRIHPHHLENDDFVSMLIDEAKISVQLNHPNVIQVVDLGRVENHYFIAMEFIRGRDLRRVMERLAEAQRGFPIEHAIAIIAQVARGLDYAHGKSDARGKKMEIVHRDISPQNVLIGFDGTVKVIDFGIAKAAGRLMETQVGILKGKYAYMSPEQAAGGTLDHRTDIFSTGIMLYECTVGRHPFRATHDIETLRNIKNSSFPPPHEANPRIPDSIERIIMRALAPKKEDRYFTAGAMADELEMALEELKPGYGRDTLSDWVSDVFADEIASGDVRPVAAPSPAKPKQNSMRLDRINTASGEGTAMMPPRPIKGPKPQEPVDTRQQGTAMVVAPDGIAKAWATVRDGVTSFFARLSANKLTPTDTVVLGALSIGIVALALLILLWEPPAGKAPKHGGTAAGGSAVAGAGTLVESDPDGAQVFLGNRYLGTTPVRVTGLALPATLTIQKAGYQPWSGPALRDGVRAKLTPALAAPTTTAAGPPAAPATPAALGNLNVTSIPPGAEVRIDGIFRGRTPLSLDLPAGSHSVAVRDRTGLSEQRPVNIAANRKSIERFKLQ